MAKKSRETVTPESFKHLTTEEIDNIVKQKLRNNFNKKWEETELVIRNQAVIDLIGQGLSRSRLIEEMMTRWGISHQCAVHYLKDAYEVLLKGNEEFIEFNRDKQVERLENIITKAIEEHEFKAAVMATAELNKLLGLTTNQRITLENTDRIFRFGGES